MQWYDLALYGAFASIIGPVFFPAEDPSTVLLAAFAVYGTALIIGPVGAVLFGRMADLRGRRAVLFPSLCWWLGLLRQSDFCRDMRSLVCLPQSRCCCFALFRASQRAES